MKPLLTIEGMGIKRHPTEIVIIKASDPQQDIGEVMQELAQRFGWTFLKPFDGYLELPASTDAAATHAIHIQHDD